MTFVQSTRATRQRLRAISAIVVRVRCGRCRRVLGRLYGDGETPVSFSDGHTEGMLAGGARIDWFRRHKGCPAQWPVRWDKLVAAYQTAAGRPDRRDRVIVLPFDL
jgi:hypothetical protein